MSRRVSLIIKELHENSAIVLSSSTKSEMGRTVTNALKIILRIHQNFLFCSIYFVVEKSQTHLFLCTGEFHVYCERFFEPFFLFSPMPFLGKM